MVVGGGGWWWLWCLGWFGCSGKVFGGCSVVRLSRASGDACIGVMCAVFMRPERPTGAEGGCQSLGKQGGGVCGVLVLGIFTGGKKGVNFYG